MTSSTARANARRRPPRPADAEARAAVIAVERTRSARPFACGTPPLAPSLRRRIALNQE